MLCPARLPAGGFETPRNFGDAPCTYLINMEPRGMSRALARAAQALVAVAASMRRPGT